MEALAVTEFIQHQFIKIDNIFQNCTSSLHAEEAPSTSAIRISSLKVMSSPEFDLGLKRPQQQTTVSAACIKSWVEMSKAHALLQVINDENMPPSLSTNTKCVAKIFKRGGRA